MTDLLSGTKLFLVVRNVRVLAEKMSSSCIFDRFSMWEPSKSAWSCFRTSFLYDSLFLICECSLNDT